MTNVKQSKQDINGIIYVLKMKEKQILEYLANENQLIMYCTL